MKTKASKSARAKLEGPGNLAKPYWAMVKAREDIHRELERMRQMKSRYEKAVERFFEELEKNPSMYTRRTVKGKKVTSVKLTLSTIRKFKKAFKKNSASSGAAQFFGDWGNCRCPERTWCVKLKCNPETLNACCYLCFSSEPIQGVCE